MADERITVTLRNSAKTWEALRRIVKESPGQLTTHNDADVVEVALELLVNWAPALRALAALAYPDATVPVRPTPSDVDVVRRRAENVAKALSVALAERDKARADAEQATQCAVIASARHNALEDLVLRAMGVNGKVSP